MRGGVVVLCLLAMTAALAQPRDDDPAGRLPALAGPLKLTPDAAAQLAVERSTQRAINEQQVIAARGKLSEVEAMTRLHVEGSASYTRSGPASSFELPEEMGGGTIDFAPTSMHTESIQLTLPVYTGGRLKAATYAAKAGIAAAEHGGAATVVQTAIAARQAVFGVLRLQQLVVVAEQRVTAVAEHRRIAQVMLEAGTAPKFEVVQAETELARARGDAIHARTAVGQQTAVLRQLLLAPQDLEVTVAEGVPPTPPEGDRHALIATALQERPEIRVLEATARAREGLVRLARASYDPSAAVVGMVNNQSATVAQASLNWSVTASLTVPIYAGGEKEAKIVQAEADLRTARLNLEAAEQQIALQVTQAQLGVDDGREALAVAEQGESEARERLRIAQVRFANGVGLGVEVLDAQTALAAAQTQVVNARYDLQVATAALRAALGLADLPKESGS